MRTCTRLVRQTVSVALSQEKRKGPGSKLEGKMKIFLNMNSSHNLTSVASAASAPFGKFRDAFFVSFGDHCHGFFLISFRHGVPVCDTTVPGLQDSQKSVNHTSNHNRAGCDTSTAVRARKHITTALLIGHTRGSGTRNSSPTHTRRKPGAQGTCEPSLLTTIGPRPSTWGRGGAKAELRSSVHYRPT